MISFILVMLMPLVFGYPGVPGSGQQAPASHCAARISQGSATGSEGGEADLPYVRH